MRRYTSRRKKALRNLAVATIILSIAFLITKLITGSKNQDEVIIATVGKEKISKSQIQNKLENIFSDEQQFVAIPQVENLPKEVLEIVIKEIIIDREILKLANKQGIHKLPKVQDKISNFKDKIIRQTYVDSIIEKEITKEKISEKYAEMTNNLSGKKEYQIAHIIVKSKDEADKILLELKSKKAPKFSELAKKYSLEQQSARNGGDLGFVLEDNLNKEIVDKLINLKKDEISQPIQTKLGWHIVKLIDYRDAKTLPYEELNERIKEQLTQNKINEINSSFTKDLKINFIKDFTSVNQGNVNNNDQKPDVNNNPEIKPVDQDTIRPVEQDVNQDNTELETEKNISSQEQNSKVSP